MFEGRKYRADIFKIAGFALLSPMGKYVLGILDFGVELLTIRGFFFF